MEAKSPIYPPPPTTHQMSTSSTLIHLRIFCGLRMNLATCNHPFLCPKIRLSHTLAFPSSRIRLSHRHHIWLPKITQVPLPYPPPRIVPSYEDFAVCRGRLLSSWINSELKWHGSKSFIGLVKKTNYEGTRIPVVSMVIYVNCSILLTHLL